MAFVVSGLLLTVAKIKQRDQLNALKTLWFQVKLAWNSIRTSDAFAVSPARMKKSGRSCRLLLEPGLRGDDILESFSPATPSLKTPCRTLSERTSCLASFCTYLPSLLLLIYLSVGIKASTR